MVKLIFLVSFTLVGCSLHSNHPSKRVTKEYEEDLVTVVVALDQAQMSYLRGCVEAKKVRVPTIPGESVFAECRDRAKLHRLELNEIMKQNLSSSGDQPSP